MNSIKRIISVILALTMVLSMFVLVQAADTGATTQAVKYAKEIEVIKAMGIINGDETGAFNADANLTRAEFAQVLTVLLKINDGEVAKENAWYYKFEIPEDLDNVLLTPSTGLVAGNETAATPVAEEKVQKFADVDEAHWAYDVIAKITDLGYMVGTSATEFSPEEAVTVNQVNKVLVKILGYEQFAMQNGGYPAGYNYIASTVKVLKGINNYGETAITRGELAKMLYNMFEVNMIAASKITDEGVATYETSDKIFLNDVLGVYKYEGKVTDNGTTAIYGNSTVEDNEIKIGNVVFKLSDDAAYSKAYIGRVVEFYTVKDEDTNDEMVIYAALAKDADEFSVEIDDFYSLANGKLEYFDEAEKKQYVDISTTPTIIFNGTKVENITKEEIKAFSNGTVTAVKSGESKNYDTIVIDAYVSVYVKNVIASEKFITNGHTSAGSTSAYASLDLKEENNKNREITIIKDGKTASFDDIKTKTILDVAVSENAIKIIISDKKATFTVSGKTVDELGESYIYDEEGNAYVIADELIKSQEIKVPDLGVKVTAYINTFGEVAAVDTSVAALSDLGLIINAYSDGRGLAKINKVRVFTQTGAFVDYELTEKVAFTNDYDEYKKMDAEDVIEKLADYKDMLAMFTLTDDGLISEIMMPTNKTLTDERTNGRLGIFYESGGAVKYYGSAFGGEAFTSKNSPKIFYVSSDPGVEERARYLIKTPSVLSNDTESDGVVAYNTDPKSVQANYILINSNKFTTHSVEIRTTEYVIVTGVKKTLSIDGDPATRISGYKLAAQNGAQTAIEYESSTGAFENMISYVGNTTNETTYEVKPGDILNLYEANGNVEYASLIFRPTLNYAKNPRYMGGAFAGQENGLFDATGKGNPFHATSGGKTLTVNGFTIKANAASGNDADKVTSSFRVFDGFAVRIADGVVTLTNQDLSDPNATLEREGYVINSYSQPTNVTVLNIKGEKASVNIGTVADVKTYDDYGYKCSRVLLNAYQGSVYKLIVINIED